MTPTALVNIERMLRHLGLFESLEVCAVEEDRVWAWPVDDRVLRHVVLGGWGKDNKQVAELNHGTRTAFREPGRVMPALQICFHPMLDGAETPWPYKLEIDFDQCSPYNGPDHAVGHFLEWFQNKTLRRKTNQRKIAELLDKRLS